MNQLREELSNVAACTAEQTTVAAAAAAAVAAVSTVSTAQSSQQLFASTRSRNLHASPSGRSHTCSHSVMPASTSPQQQPPWLCAVPPQGPQVSQTCTPPREQILLQACTLPRSTSPAEG